PTPTERAIVRTLAPDAYFSRNTSRTFRIDNLSPGIAVLLAGGPRYRSSDRRLRPRTPSSGCPRSIGITVRLPSESVAALHRNHCPLSLGFRTIGGRSFSSRYSGQTSAVFIRRAATSRNRRAQSGARVSAARR